MAKQKITVTVDEDLVEAVRAEGHATLSAVVNAALAREVDRRARHAALGRMLAEWEAAEGPVSAVDEAAAREAFAELETPGTGAA
ncbi:MAG: type II toxin-antitoxin system CcdA family antitoxin [Sporichthyaceae bacterium]